VYADQELYISGSVQQNRSGTEPYVHING